MPGYTANALFRFQNGTLHLTVDEGVLLVEVEIHFIVKVAVPVLRQNIPDVFRRYHLKKVSEDKNLFKMT